MNFEQILRLKKHVLIAPLDWGLGHATRCIPIIKILQKNGCRVSIAAEGGAKTLLEAEFPGIAFINLHGYNVQYSLNKRFLPLKILAQAPKIMLAIRHEHAWLQKAVDEYGFDAVISDNRFGLYTRKVPCVFITHQLLIQVPFGWLQKLVQHINYRYINHYAQCWVPDFEGEMNIAGELSHPAKLPAAPVSYLGPLVRFEKMEKAAPRYKWMVILSGPEPQRTILENKLVGVIKSMHEKVLLVRGKPGSSQTIATPPNCTIASHLSTADMLQSVAASEYVISRCGYTTVMEMLALGKKTVLIPTPGQTEQVYLARRLSQQGWCYTCTQDDDLEVALSDAERFNYNLPAMPANQLEEIVKQFVESLQH